MAFLQLHASCRANKQQGHKRRHGGGGSSRAQRLDANLGLLLLEEEGARRRFVLRGHRRGPDVWEWTLRGCTGFCHYGEVAPEDPLPMALHEMGCGRLGGG